MPLVRVSLMESKSEEFTSKLDNILRRTIIETLYAPGKEAMQVITEYRHDHLTYGSSDSARRRDDVMVIEITLTEGRSTEVKNELFKKMAERLKADLNFRPEALFMNLVEIKPENWAWRRA